MTKLFFRLTLPLFTIFMSCSDSDEPASSDVSQACQIIKLLREYDSYSYSFNSTGQLVETVYTYGTTPNTKYRLEYASDKVKISSTAASLATPAYELSATYSINNDGFPLSRTNAQGLQEEKYVYNGSKLSYYVTRSFDGALDDSVVMVYDAAGKNIVQENFFNYKTASKSWSFSYAEDFTYDTKNNPYYKRYGIEGDDIYQVHFFSQNNISSDADQVYAFNYNAQNFPVLRNGSGSKAYPLTYEYLCK